MTMFSRPPSCQRGYTRQRTAHSMLLRSFAILHRPADGLISSHVVADCKAASRVASHPALHRSPEVGIVPANAAAHTGDLARIALEVHERSNKDDHSNQAGCHDAADHDEVGVLLGYVQAALLALERHDIVLHTCDSHL